MKAKSIKGNSVEEIEAALAKSKNDGFVPTLAFVFITIIENAEPIRTLFNKENIAIFGASTEMPKADAVVVFSCAGRILALGPLINEEIEGVKNVWNVPMAGMFSNSELGRATGGNLEMHNATTCVIALKEK